MSGTEEQRLNKSRELAECGGVMGLNLGPEFLAEGSEDSRVEDMVKHILHIRNIAGIDVLALGSDSSIADFFVVAGANSEPQLRALTSFIERQVREVYQLRPISGDMDSNAGWTLLDFGDVIVHLMLPEIREKYQLETLWGERTRA